MANVPLLAFPTDCQVLTEKIKISVRAPWKLQYANRKNCARSNDCQTLQSGQHFF